MANKLVLLQEDVKVGDEVALFLTTAREVHGRVAEITESYIKLETTPGTFSRFFEKMIEGWEVRPKTIDAAPEQLSENVQAHVPPIRATHPTPLTDDHPQSPSTECQPPATLAVALGETPVAATCSSNQTVSPHHNSVGPNQAQRDHATSVAPRDLSPLTPGHRHNPGGTGGPFVTSELLSALYRIEAQTEARMATARVALQPPPFELPDTEVLSKGSKTYRQLWERIKNRYTNARKINELDPKFGRIQPIVNDLRQLAGQYPTSVILKRHLAYCLALAHNGSDALVVAKETARLPDADVSDWINLAALAVQQHANELACLALEQVFRQRPAKGAEAAWYVFLRLAHAFGNYLPLGSLFDATQEPPAGEDDLLTQASVYLLKVLHSEESAANALRACRESGGKRAVVCEVLAQLPAEVAPTYRQVVEDWVWESRVPETPPESPGKPDLLSYRPAERSNNLLPQRQLHGRIARYNKGQNFGFIDDGSSHSHRRGNHFFHRSSVIDDQLLQHLEKGTGEDLPVVFQSAEGPRGKVALQISQHRTPREAFDLAKVYADEGEYARAIALIRPLIDQPDLPKARELYENWREFARATGVPRGNTPYAKARRLQLIEKNFGPAIDLFRKAIQIGDNAESAIKDLAALFVQMDRAAEAVELLERHRRNVSDRRSLENHLLGVYQKAGEWAKAEELLKGKLRATRTSDRDHIMLLRQIARAAIEQERYSDAEQHLSKARQLQPDNPSLGRDLALCLSRQRRFDEAEQLLSKFDRTDSRISEMLDAIAQARQSGVMLPMDADGLLIETNLSDISSELSSFTHFFLRRCTFEGVRTDRLNEGHYSGTADDLEFETRRLDTLAKELGTIRPRDRSNVCLSAARIRLDLREGDHSSVYRYICRSFASRGDASVGEKCHLDTARAWYVEALRAYDGDRAEYRHEKQRGDEQDAINAMVRCLYSMLGQGRISLTKTLAIDASIEEVINHHPQREKVFDLLLYLSTNSKFAGERIVQRLHNSRSLQTAAYEYLRGKGVVVPSSAMPTMEQFVKWWNELRLRANSEYNRLCVELRSLQGCQLTTAWLENGMERLKSIADRLMFDLDRQRVLELKDVLDQVIEMCNQNRFEEVERICNQADLRCQDMLRQIEERPTKISVEELYTVVEGMREKVNERLRELYDTARPAPELRLAVESYCPDQDRRIEVQVVVENKMGRGPAESVEVILDEVTDTQDDDEALFTAEKSELPIDGSLRGGEQRIVYMPLRLSDRVLQQQDFSIPLHAQFRTRSGEIETTSMAIFPIRLNPEGEFKEIDNPFANYAEGSIVDDPEMFIGRGPLIESIARVIRAPRKGVVVFGQKRAGKSSILYHLKNRLRRHRDVVVIDVGNIASLFTGQSQLSLFDSMLWTILRELGRELRNPSELPPLTEPQIPTFEKFVDHQNRLMLFSEIFRDFTNARAQSSEWRNVRCVLLIDEFSYVYHWILCGELPETFMKNWKALLQEDFFNAVIVGQDNMPKFKERFANEFGIFQDERISYLKRDDAIRLIEQPLAIIGSDGQRHTRFRERAVDRLLELTAGSPFYIQMICNSLVEYMNRKRARLVTEADVELVKDEMIRGFNALTKDKFENLFNSGDTSEDAISDDDALRICTAVALNSRTGQCNAQTIACETQRPLNVILDDLVRRDVLECERGHYYHITVGLFKEWLLANQGGTTR